MTINEYFNAQRQNLASIRQFAPFALLCPLVDALYRTSIGLIPNNVSPVFGQFLLICHKSFLSASSLIGQAQPDDASSITRRAIEVARLAVAVKNDPRNADEWIAYEQRSMRWKKRLEAERPPPLRVRIAAGHPLINELMDIYGILSDAEVHFTPEYFISLPWEHRENQMYLSYFMAERREIMRAITLLSAAHIKIIDVLNWCLNDAFGRDTQWNTLRNRLIVRGRYFGNKLKEDPHAYMD